MKFSLAINTFLCLFHISFSQSWQQLPNFPASGRDDGSVFNIGNNVYCGLGGAAGIGPSTDFYKFNSIANTWATSYMVAALPATGRQYCSSFSYNNYGYIVGGLDVNYNASNLVWRYDTLTNSWAQKTSIPDSIQGAVCFFINNKAYICGGRDKNNNCTAKVWQYNPANDTWLQKNNMPDNGRWRASGTVINNKGYLIFGADSLQKFSKNLYEYDPGNDTWALIDSFPGMGRTYASAFNANNKFVIAFGIDTGNAVYNDCHIYDLNLHQWINQSPLPSFGRKGCMAFTFNNNIYITVGIDGGSNRLTETWMAGNVNGIEKFTSLLAEIQVYPNPANGTLTINYNLSCKEASLQLTELSSGRVLVNKNIPCHSTQMQIDMSELADGVYSLSIKSNSSAAKNIRVIKVQ